MVRGIVPPGNSIKSKKRGGAYIVELVVAKATILAADRVEGPGGSIWTKHRD